VRCTRNRTFLDMSQQATQRSKAAYVQGFGCRQ
jgi:hypothetical protein